MTEYLDSNALYFIAGTLLTILLFVVGIYYNKKLINRIEASFVLSEWLPIITTTKDIQFLQLVNYKPPQDTNVYYLKAALANSGNLDIDQSIIQQGISIEFPDDFLIVKSEVYSFDETEVNSTVDRNLLTIDWKLLKPSEKNYVELILESKDIWKQNDLEKKLVIKHRIVNLSKVKVFSIYGRDLKSFNEKIRTSNWLMLGCFFMALLWSYFIYEAKHRDITTFYPGKNFETYSADNFHRINDSVVVFSVENREYAIKTNEISKYFKIDQNSSNSFQPYLIVFAVTGIMFCMLLFINLHERRARKRAMIFSDVS